MKNQISSVILMVVLFVSGGQICQAEMSQSLKERRKILSRELKKEMVHVSCNIHVAVGFDASNATMIEGSDGVIIVDGLYGTEAAGIVLGEFRKITPKPVKAIIFTHTHTDHVGGTTVFYEKDHPPIYGRKSTNKKLPGYDKLSDILTKRGQRQFGSFLTPEEKIDGIAPVIRPGGGAGAGKMKATHYMKSNRENLEIAGIRMELVAAPGETDDHLFVWIPESKTLICGDNFYMSFPNIYAVRGTPYRDVSQWIRSLNLIIRQGAEHLISGHARPISGKEKIRNILSEYRDGIAHIYEKTLEGMNRGESPDHLAHSVKLPDHLKNNPYLQEFYGVIAWSVRSIYGGYVGWFDGNPTNLFPLAPIEEGKRMIRLAGSKDKLIRQIKTAISKNDNQWACQLADYILAVYPDHKKTKVMKAKALRHLADRQISSNARHYYLSVARELESED